MRLISQLQLIGRAHGARGFRLTLVLCTTAAALLVAPVAANACASLAGVKAYHGEASMAFSATASAPDSASGGTQTISLNRTAEELKIDLPVKVANPTLGYVEFLGSVTGGDVSVRDTVLDSGGGSTTTGEQTYSGPTLRGPADLTFNTRTCKYSLIVPFGVRAGSTGDFAEPDPAVDGVAFAPPHHIPGSLQLGGAPVVEAYDGCPAGSGSVVGALPGPPRAIPHAPGCYDIEGGWISDFTLLSQCDGTTADNCVSGNPPEGTALFSWLLTPGAAPPHLFVIISTSFIRAGQTSLVHLSVTWKGQPATGAVIAVGGQTTHANHHGQTSIALHAEHPGYLLVTIHYHGKKSTAVIAVSS